jgi:hypothetical protein
MSDIQYVASKEIKCGECNREFLLTVTDFTKSDVNPSQFIWKCPKCCGKNIINYENMPVSFRDSL